MSLSEQPSPREYPRPTEATKDTSCRCYLRGPDGVRRLSPSGTWDTMKYSPDPGSGKPRSRLHDGLRDLTTLAADHGLLHDHCLFLHADGRRPYRVFFAADLRHLDVRHLQRVALHLYIDLAWALDHELPVVGSLARGQHAEGTHRENGDVPHWGPLRIARSARGQPSDHCRGCMRASRLELRASS